MQRFQITLTDEDLQGNVWISNDCPVYRAIHQTIPKIEFVLEDSCGFGPYCLISLPDQIADIISTLMLNPNAAIGPFSFVLEVPDHINLT